MTRYEPYCDCLGGNVSMVPDPNGRWCRAEVKPPEWYDCTDGTSHDHDSQYEIDRESCSNFGFRLIRAKTGGATYLSHHPSMEAAKTAAQQDFKARTLSALVEPSRADEGWQDISTAPLDTPVSVKVGSMAFEAVLRPDAAMNEAGEDCCQWQAVHEGEHPPCWSDGACWASNDEGIPSREPTHWRQTTEADHA